MSDEVGVAESVSDLAKQSGLKNYLWLYFLIVPLAASTASAVALVIAALQGLAGHELASQIYARTLLIGFKAIGIIAAAYITGLLLALGSVFIISRRVFTLQERETRSRAELAHYRKTHPKTNEVPGDLGEYQFMMNYAIQQHGKRQQLLVVAAVSYSAILLVVAFSWLLTSDVSELWHLVNMVAQGLETLPSASEAPIPTSP
jgi:hypothetical protein